VKHFKFTPKGKRRIHQNPNTGEIKACRFWLQSEIELVRPKLILSMGGTAAESLTGSRKGILSRRGTIEATAEGVPVFLTVHPSYLLRLPDPALRDDETAKFCADLKSAQAHLEELRAG
jgi:DNA polymerase